MSTAISVTVLILFWLACAVCAIRLFDIVAGGLDEFDRGFVVPMALLCAPLILIVAVAAYAYHRLSTGRTGAAFVALLYPGHTRYVRRENTRKALRDKAAEYWQLARETDDRDERRLFNDVADDYTRQADQLRDEPL